MTELDPLLNKVTRPGRYTGGEWNSTVKNWDAARLRLALIFPDAYEIGMSNMALPILYEILNEAPGVLAERAFAPWPDMEEALRKAGRHLYSLESKRPLKDFDVLAFSLGYELTYTNVLNMLDAGGVPPRFEDRTDGSPLVIAGGSCALNPEPMADFIDFFVLGDGEEVILDVVELLKSVKGISRRELLRKAAMIAGVYVPNLYEVTYKGGVFSGISPTVPEAAPTVERRMVAKLPPPVVRPIVPYIEVVHDRGAVEIQRGCSRGCRFCQAGMIYRPVRERPQQEVVDAVGEIMHNCGYSEVSLVSLSTSDYQGIDGLVSSLLSRYGKDNLTLSLPSLRIDESSVRLMESLHTRRKMGFTFAPEAGSERMRRSINKSLTQENILSTATAAFERGWTSIKLYFMVGLPGETDEDVAEIGELVRLIRQAGRAAAGRLPNLRVSASTCIPKPHTPIQWLPQSREEELTPRLNGLRRSLQRQGTPLAWHDPRVSLLEAVMSRGDRRLGQVIYNAWKLGCKFDAWTEHFKFDRWMAAFASAGLDPDCYAHREIGIDEPLPWGHINTGVNLSFLKAELGRMRQDEPTPDCRNQVCNLCGFQGRYPECREKATAPGETGRGPQ